MYKSITSLLLELEGLKSQRRLLLYQWAREVEHSGFVQQFYIMHPKFLSFSVDQHWIIWALMFSYKTDS